MLKNMTNSPAPGASLHRPEDSILRNRGRSIFLFLAITLALGASTLMAQSMVYNAVPATLAPSYPSQPFQAQQTNEFGDFVHLAGINRALNSVTMTMVTWAPEAEGGNVAYCSANPGLCSATGWNHPFTLNIYGAPTGSPNVRDVGPLLATVTQSKFVPWRPAEDPVNCPTKDSPGYAFKWQSVPGPADTNCSNGFAYNVTFDMSSLGTVLPNDVIVGIVYNTQTYGPSPLGVGGPFNSLNVGVPSGNAASVGMDDNSDNVFWDTETAGLYTDLGASGFNEFREDSNWTPYGTVPIKITATAPTTTNLVVVPNSPIFDENNVVGVSGDFAPGFASGSFASDGSGKTDIQFSPQSFFGRDVSIGEIKSMSYYTKTGATHTVDPRDWFVNIYTKPYVGDVSTPTWYGDRIGTEPYFSESLSDPANTWNQWNTVIGNNQLRFFESTAGAPGATFGSYTDPHWDAFKAGNALSGQPYAGHQVLYFAIQTGSAWANGFTGQLDGFRMELLDGSVVTVNFETCNQVSIPTGITTLMNQQVTVPINIDDVTGRNVLGYSSVITYDQSKLQYVGFDQVGTLSSGFTVTVNSGTLGQLNIFAYGTIPPTGPGALLKLRFLAIGPISAASTPINFTSFSLNEGVPCTNTTNGSVVIISSTVTGKVTYVNAPVLTPVPLATLSGAGSVPVSTMTASDGTYSLSGFGAGPYTVTPSKAAQPIGTVNGITPSDSSMIAQAGVGYITLNANQAIAADVTNNGTVSPLDAAYIAQWSVGIVNPGITGSWKFLPASRSYPSGIVTAQTNQDYSGILMGDVSGSWSPTLLGGTFAPIIAANPAESSRALLASVPELTSVPGTVVNVPVEIQDLTGRGVMAYQFDLRFDPNVIEPSEIASDIVGTLSDRMNIVTNSPEPGLLKVAVYGITPIIGKGVLVNLRFSTIGDIGSSSKLLLGGLMLNEGGIAVRLGNGGVTVKSSTDGVLIGQLSNTFGRGISTARVSVTDTKGEVQTVLSGPTGKFEFGDLRVGETYTLYVAHKQYTFTSRSVVVTEDRTNVDMISEQ